MIYTSIIEYGGGTYVSQYSTRSPRFAAIAHLTELQNVVDMPRDAIEALDETPTAIEGLVGVWCMTSTGPNGLVLINIVATHDLVGAKVEK